EIAPQICEILYKHNIQSLIIEGGRQTLQTFIDMGLWDEARVFSGKSQFKKGIKAPNFSGTIISEERIGTDILKMFRND
ncbi:MAG TPA: dihydrofolate reductase family protein, partial [Salinimicrobium sp.]|nr:dihydrofolate reductase family protein [Salinimicrobium sp.]